MGLTLLVGRWPDEVQTLLQNDVELERFRALASALNSDVG